MGSKNTIECNFSIEILFTTIYQAMIGFNWKMPDLEFGF